MNRGVERSDEPGGLMVAVQNGDEDAFRLLTRRLYGPAIGIATKVLGDRSEAEDAVQAALVKLWRQAASFDAGKAKVETWFRRIVVNACIDRKRSLKPVQPLELVAERASDDPDPEALAGQSARSRRIAEAMAHLPARQRTAIALFYGEGATMNEIAEALETTPKAVEGLLARARVELAERLRPLAEEVM
ncbi:RNA polymerase sigma factor [Sphingosinicella xenopeptidilytica]|uniref:RNA polymerase sigma factor n=1 Tax=Sphingosinicella xenopeptidilytica TaxID=364098 RepID=A0ABW3C542_SPHXN